MSDTSSGPSWLIETTDATFEADVLVRSQLGLVIVDFWADWCAPCRMLAPILEKVIGEYDGQITLVKANTDVAQMAAAQFGVQGIPALFAVYDGRVLDALQGAVSEQALRDWIDRAVQHVELARLEQLVEQAPDEAERRLRPLVQQSATAQRASVLLLRALHQQGKMDEVRALLSELEQRGFLEPEVQRIKAELDLQAAQNVDVQELQRRVAAEPENYDVKMELARALAARGEHERALQMLLEIVEADRHGAGEKAKEHMLEIFRVLGDEHELTGKYRRQLALALY